MAFSEEEDAALGILVQQFVDDLFHQSRRIYLSFMGCERRDAYPLLEILLGSYLFGQQIQITTFLRKDGAEVRHIHRIAQALKHFKIVLKRGGQLFLDLVLKGNQVPAVLAMLVDMLHPIAAQIETHTEIFGAQHVVQVGNLRELFGYQSAIERVEALDAVILHLQVGLHEVDIGSQVVEQRTGITSTQHRDAYVWILCGQ